MKLVRKKRINRTTLIVTAFLLSSLFVATFLTSSTLRNFDTRSKAAVFDTAYIQYPFGKAFKLSRSSNLHLHVDTALNKPILTMEGWFKADTPYNYGYLIHKRYSNGLDYREEFSVQTGILGTSPDKYLYADVLTTGSVGSYLYTNINPLTDGSWHHIAYVRRNTGLPCMKLFVDGVQITDFTYGGGWGCGTMIDGGGDLLIGTKVDLCTAYGCSFVSFDDLNVDEVRISDTDRYSSNFTVSREPFVSDANTLLLLHFDGNMVDSSSHFSDADYSSGKFVDSTIVVNPTPTPPPAPTQVIDLDTGWNWITIKNTPANPDITAALSSISGKYDRVLSETGIYASEIPLQFNTLTSLEAGSMYLIHMTSPGTVSFTGTPVSEDKPIRLHAGWNWIGYYGDSPLSVDTALASISGKYQRLLSQELYYDAANPSVSSLQSMEPNQGYMLYSDIDQTLIYPSGSGQALLGTKTDEPGTGCDKTITNVYTNIYGHIQTKKLKQDNNYLVRLVTPSSVVAGCGELSGGLMKIARAFGQETINGKTYPGFNDGDEIFLQIVDERNGRIIQLLDTHLQFSNDLLTHRFDILE